MPDSYAAAEGRAKEGFRAAGFGPTRTANYESAWARMPENYRAKVKPGIEDKWARNWIAKMRE